MQERKREKRFIYPSLTCTIALNCSVHWRDQVGRELRLKNVAPLDRLPSTSQDYCERSRKLATTYEREKSNLFILSN